MKHTAKFTVSRLTVGSVVTGVSEGTAKDGRRIYSTAWSGIYDGIRPSEWTGEPEHFFHDGIIGDTPQRCFAMPVSKFPKWECVANLEWQCKPHAAALSLPMRMGRAGIMTDVTEQYTEETICRQGMQAPAFEIGELKWTQ